MVAGFLTNSLALLSDAGHMLTDVIGIGMALAAIQLADRFEKRSARATSPKVVASTLSRKAAACS